MNVRCVVMISKKYVLNDQIKAALYLKGRSGRETHKAQLNLRIFFWLFQYVYVAEVTVFKPWYPPV